MPKLFMIEVKVEETEVIPVLRVLHRVPGIVDVKADFDQILPNGHGRKRKERAAPLMLPAPAGHSRAHKPTKKGGITGFKFMAGVIGNSDKHLTTKDLADAFEADGRSRKSIASTIWKCKKEGLVSFTEGKGYFATKKLRDRMRNSTFATTEKE